MNIDFYKYHGAGNDFILIDNCDNTYSTGFSNELVHKLCERHFGIGADGLIIIEKHQTYDFQMRYFNADGNESTMCGNGGRCIVAFANYLGLIKSRSVFTAADGIHEAFVINNEYIKLKMIDVINPLQKINDFEIDTGSPHYIQYVNNLDSLDVFTEGSKIRNSKEYKTEGINVNFVEKKENCFYIRTFERGVENETMACGTGSVAVAISSKIDASNGHYSVNIQTLGGNLIVEFDKFNDTFKNIYLTGSAILVYKGSYIL